MPQALYKSQSLSPESAAQDYPYTAKRTWQLTQDNFGNTTTKFEAFAFVQIYFTGATIPKVCIASGDINNTVNPVYAPFPGCIIPVCGIGFVTSGTDCHGTAHTTDAVTGLVVIAMGGNKMTTSIQS